MVIFINGDDIVIPVEVERFGNIKAGESQILQYQTDWRKKYGILTDGNEWRLYFDRRYETFHLEDILEKKSNFWEKWKLYITPDTYYDMAFNPKGQLQLFETERLNPCTPENRPFFFNDITTLLNSFKTKISDIYPLLYKEERQAVETTYSYVIQFILYKVLIDNNYKKLKDEYETFREWVKKAIQTKTYGEIIKGIKNIAEYIYKNIYEPFRQKQEDINKNLIEQLKKSPTLDDIAPWLDIILFIDRYNFSDIRNELFGFVYENYLKELYHDENKGQYFTDPAVVNFMLQELGYTKETIEKSGGKNISIIDPSCGAGTFLYSATLAIKEAFDDGTETNSKMIENLVNNNIFGLDIEEFPLFLAEMNILMQLLPVIVAINYDCPIKDKLKLFITKDSIAEFLDTPINRNNNNDDDNKGLFDDFDNNNTPTYMRDRRDLVDMFKSLEGDLNNRQRFDYVIGNPPYIGYNECSKMKLNFVKKIQDKDDNSITMGDVYGINLNSVPNIKKAYAPKPNLYAFFIALGLGLLKKNGKICYIIPQTILTASDLDVLRYHLAKHTTIEKIITFEGNLFIGRGVKQKKPIPTSSLIFVIKKIVPSKNHVVKVLNYKPYTNKQGSDFDTYFRSRNKDSKNIIQETLFQKLENWNFIKQDEKVIELINEYNLNTYTIEEYRKNVLKHYDEVQFDKGLVFEKKKINLATKDYSLIKKIKGYYNIAKSDNYISSKYIRLPSGTQGLQIFDNKYKIIWGYMNFDKFYFSDQKIMIDFNWVILSSQNKTEILFLLAVLNSSLSFKIFELFLRSENEQAILIGIKSIKQYIRVPKITSGNKHIKEEIIKQTEALLDLEKPTINKFVDFPHTAMQTFEFVRVEGNNIILTNGNHNYTAKINRGKSDIVKSVIEAKYFPKSPLIPSDSINLEELRFLPVIDFDKQAKLKSYIDDLVFALYFDLSINNLGTEYIDDIHKTVSKNEYYTLIEQNT